MLPGINEIPQTRDIIDTFAGYNHTDNVLEGQFYDMQNLSSDNYPAISARKKRDFIKKLEKPNGLYFADALVYVDGTEFYYNSNKVFDVEDSEKTIVKMGAYIVVFPDKICYNTETDEYFDLENNYISRATISVEPSTYDGEKLDYSIEKPAETDGVYWLDNTVLKVYSATYSSWMPVPTSYVRIYEHYSETRNELFGEGFEAGDTVTFSGFEDDDLNGDFIVYKCENGYMVIGSAPKVISQSDVSFSRLVPDMDYVFELNNRLWGCSGHEIYASKLGDPTNWRAYAGLVSDSYTLTVGASGEFTGACAYNGNAMFFKEGSVISIYGTQPSNFTMNETNISGVEKGSNLSIANLNGVLYYKSKEGIMSYSGGIPVKISGPLGERFMYAVGGVTADKYYVSMMNDQGNYNLFAYDTLKGIWMKEDGSRIKYFANDAGTLYYMTDEGLYVIKNRAGKTACPSVIVNIKGKDVSLCPGMFCPSQVFNDDYLKEVEWSGETGDFMCELPDRKYVSKITVRLQTDNHMTLYIQYDGDGVWERIMNINKTRKRSVTIPLRIRRCDFFRLKFEGEGYFKIYSIAKSIERGSEI